MRLIEDSGSVEPEDIFALRRQITNIGDTNEDHAFCIDVLEKVESAASQLQRLHWRMS